MSVAADHAGSDAAPGGTEGPPDRPLRAEEYLHVPYAMSIWSRRNERGEWVRHVEYPELPGCVVESAGIVDAMEHLEVLKNQHILDRLARGEPVPVPRPPLRA